MGIKPIHPNGWLMVAVFWIIEIPLMLAAGGYFGLDPILQFAAAIGFVAVAIVTFAITFWKFKDDREL